MARDPVKIIPDWSLKLILREPGVRTLGEFCPIPMRELHRRKNGIVLRHVSDETDEFCYIPATQTQITEEDALRGLDCAAGRSIFVIR